MGGSSVSEWNVICFKFGCFPNVKLYKQKMVNRISNLGNSNSENGWQYLHFKYEFKTVHIHPNILWTILKQFIYIHKIGDVLQEVVSGKPHELLVASSRAHQSTQQLKLLWGWVVLLAAVLSVYCSLLLIYRGIKFVRYFSMYVYITYFQINKTVAGCNCELLGGKYKM